MEGRKYDFTLSISNRIPNGAAKWTEATKSICPRCEQPKHCLHEAQVVISFHGIALQSFSKLICPVCASGAILDEGEECEVIVSVLTEHEKEANSLACKFQDIFHTQWMNMWQLEIAIKNRVCQGGWCIVNEGDDDDLPHTRMIVGGLTA